MERTLVLIKPDAVQRGLIGQVISRLEDRGLKIVGLSMATTLRRKPFAMNVLRGISGQMFLASHVFLCHMLVVSHYTKKNVIKS